MSKIEMIKAVGNLVISLGVGTIVGNAIMATTPVNTGKIAKICIKAGTFVLSTMASEKAAEYAEIKFDNAVNSVKEMVKKGEI